MFDYDNDAPTWSVLIRRIGNKLTREGYLMFYDDFMDRERVYQTDPSLPPNNRPLRHTTKRHVREEVVPALVLRLLDIMVECQEEAIAARDTATAIRANERGTGYYLRFVTEHALDMVPEPTPEEIDALDDARDASVAQWVRTKYDNRRERRREAREAARFMAEDIVPSWLEALPEGRHTFTDLWRTWSAAVPAPECEALGRNSFYDLVRANAEVKRSGNREYIVR